MEVLFVRHAIAEDADAVGSDFARALTSKGRKQFRTLAKWISELEAPPDLILSSPLVRAVQTAEILCEITGVAAKNCRVDEHLSPGIDPARLAAYLEQLGSPRIALVGHEPDMSHCVAEFIGGGRVNFTKGAIACVQFEVDYTLGCGTLAWFVNPKLLD